MSDLSQLQKALESGFLPDLDLPVDQWSDRYMIIPKSSGSNEYGPYRTERTPHARAIMNALSDSHPCKRVVCMVASQMFKTQIALNWLGSTIHQSPSNFLWLMPTGKLHKRIAARIDKTIAAVQVLKERVAKPNSRDAQNNQDTKEYIGGALFIATAGAAANLSEVPARRVAFDEIDRAEINVDGEGDPVKLSEARQTTFAQNRKSYYYSSPTIEGESRIYDLYMMGTQKIALAECIHCGHAQDLIFEKLITTESGDVLYPCVECGGLHKESDKQRMFKNGLFSDGAKGDGETESFTASAMFLPYGWLSWKDMMSEYQEAKKLLDIGLEEPMIVFYNTRLARCWERKHEKLAHNVLRERAEKYKLDTVPAKGLLLTAAIDTQADRLEIQVMAWGRDMEAWVIAYYIIMGDPAEYQTFEKALEVIDKPFKHASGAELKINCTFIDSGGSNTQDVYNFARKNQHKDIYALKGGSNPFAEIIDGRPSKRTVNARGVRIKKGVEVWIIGVKAAKDLLYSRLKLTEGRGMIHFSRELPEEYFKQVVSEHIEKYYHRGQKTHKWVCPKNVRNEAWDLLVYNVACAYKLGLHTVPDEYWNNLSNSLKPDAVVGGAGGGKVSLINWRRGNVR